MKHGIKTLLKYSTLSSAKTSWEFTETPQNLGYRAELGRFSLLSEIQKRAAKSTDSYHQSAFTYQQKHPESDPMHYLVENHQLNSTIGCKHSKVKETEQKITQEAYIHDRQQKWTQVKEINLLPKNKIRL